MGSKFRKVAVICLLVPLLGLLATVIGQPGEAVAQPTVEEIATGLNNPRGLAFGPDGALYVAESGSGGPGPCAEGPEGERCLGFSSSVTRVDLLTGSQSRIGAALPSLAGEGGNSATGIHGIAFEGQNRIYLSIGWGGDPNDRVSDFGFAGAAFARVVGIEPGRRFFNLTSDLGQYEAVNNPTGDDVDTNPYGIAAVDGKQIVADAGGNNLIEIDSNGNISTLAIFPDRPVDAPPFLGLPPGAQIPMDAVPTAVTVGPDGDYYVGQLTGFPFPVGAANVYRVPAEGGTPEVVASGFSAIIGVASGDDGTLYVLELAQNGLLAAFGGGDWSGRIVAVAPDGSQSEVVSDGLFAPGGIAVGPDGHLYVTNNSIFSGTGNVLKVYLD